MPAVTKEEQESIFTSLEKTNNTSAGFKGYASEDLSTGEVQHEIKRGLKSRHVTMIALGGTIGTGLFVGTGSALGDAGPVGALIAYLFLASIIYGIAQSLAEMATYIPITGSFAVFATRFVSAPLGAAMGWLYWFSWAITFAIEVNVAGLIIEYWTTAVPNAGWVTIFLVILTAINFFPVKYYGEIEFWTAIIKVLAIIGWLIYALCMVCGAGVSGPVGFRYWRNPGPMGPGLYYQDSNLNAAKFLGWLGALVNAAFTFQGCELIGITAGEAKNPRKTIPSAVNSVIFRIFVFYIGAVFFMGLLVPFNYPGLTSTDSSNTYISASPFVIAIVTSGTPILPHIFNAVILITVISAGNANVYVASRTLHALSVSGTAPRFFQKVNRWGIPYYSVALSASLGLLAYMASTNDAKVVFDWLVSLSAVSNMFAWIMIVAAHIRFMKALVVQGKSRDDLPFKATLQPYLSWYSMIATIFLTLVQGFGSFFDFTVASFLTSYLCVFAFIIVWVIFEFIYKFPGLVPYEEMDLLTGRKEFDDEDGNEIVWEEAPPKNIWEKLLKIIF
ncbi:hypothetical protein NADFUDRAFT_48964 [Nadsonia fulvescens var. elongata DSM 6958]|uniref:Amino acid permease/ SLC12A domain-containing protein n=1 Tax=Nadsonia fulvescens var. elongata DSM 6958 TaxID=857566 RepID=A0A1E3PU06_9ASCO|nr:hypothetical protein NADFUDRAFT_48964 [Nadsonia fulvescens var. elongata DSM 6958]